MKNSLLMVFLLIIMGCKDTSQSEAVTADEVDDFMENVFGEKKTKALDCNLLISNTDFSKLCMTNEDNFTIKKDIENPLICIHVLKSKNSTVDIAINSSPMAMLTGQVFKSAKATAGKRGTVERIRRLGEDAFYSEHTYEAGDYTTENKDLTFYQGKSMFTLHTVSSSKSNTNCMSDKSQLKKLAKALLESLKK